MHWNVPSRNAVGKLPQVVDNEDEGTMERILIMLIVFAVSLFAVSFPTITATFRSIRVPSILFFIGKHFGTGVILSTAFVHLLQDAFKALLKSIVNERWKNIGDWAGMIVLASLLCIFFVEYISTAYVDRLQSYSSVPSTPTASAPASSASSVQLEYEPPTATRPSILVQSPHGTENWIEGVLRPRDSSHPLRSTSLPDETTPLNPISDVTPTDAFARSRAYGATVPRLSNRPPARPSHHVAHISAPPGDAFFSGGHHRHEPRDMHASHHARVSRWRWLGFLGLGGDSEEAGTVHPDLHITKSGGSTQSKVQTEPAEESEHEHAPERGGCQHHGHAHMDMERWMHGIDSECTDRPEGHAHGHMHDDSVDEECGGAPPPGDDAKTKVGRRRQVIGILVLQLGIMIHSLVIGLTLSITTGSEFTSLVIAIVFHQLFEGLSLGIRIAGLPSSDSEHGFRHLPGHTLKPFLAVSFATTTPLGIGIGLVALGGAGKSTGPHLILVQGVMSAVSAGMLIYAACVEMLAGDFVMDAHLWRGSVRRQALALGSLLAGVCAMAAIG
ncbi:Zinc/iron permease [Daedaleopsis nitida]|nr:Zinc/iron permease [Daedaleopsis nitida]